MPFNYTEDNDRRFRNHEDNFWHDRFLPNLVMCGFVLVIAGIAWLADWLFHFGWFSH